MAAISMHTPTTMHTALVCTWGIAPKYVEVELPAVPSPDSNLVQVKVLATGLPNFVRSRALGTHPTSGSLPHVPGADGVGTILTLPANPKSLTPLSVGQTVYFVTFQTGGSFSDIINVPATDMVSMPEDADPIHIAALMNPALSSWMSLRTRTSNLSKDFTVLILGATSTSGELAIHLARHLGASRVIGAARNENKLAKLDLDVRVLLAAKPEDTDWSAVGHVDLILDYVYGAATIGLLSSLKMVNMGGKITGPIQYVHVGSLGGMTMDLPGKVLRMVDLTIRGSGPGSWSMRQLKGEMLDMLTAVSRMPKKDVFHVGNLADIEMIWSKERADGKRVVIVP